MLNEVINKLCAEIEHKISEIMFKKVSGIEYDGYSIINIIDNKATITVGYSDIEIVYYINGELKSINIESNFTKKDEMRDFIPKLIKLNSCIDKMGKIIKDVYSKNIKEFRNNNPEYTEL